MWQRDHEEDAMRDLIERHLRDWESGWSMGSFGAVAEFHQDEGEPAEVAEPLARATARGAISIDADVLSRIQAVTYETPSPKRHRWSHALALCLPRREATRDARRELVELGPDAGAVRPVDRNAVLFDMGLGLPQCDFCIRTADQALITVLRAAHGRSLFEPNNPAMGAILSAHPHRVAATNLGRVEVFQKIGGPDTGGVSPAGPHTHLLPKLMQGKRTHAATTPIPDGLVPLGYLHPGNPVIGAMGEDRPFDAALHEAFQALLQRFGTADATAAKASLQAALNEGRDPEGYAEPSSRTGRASLKVGLRQASRLAERSGDQPRMNLVKAWQRQFDNAGTDDDADDMLGH
jgi:hypothetical protein